MSAQHPLGRVVPERAKPTQPSADPILVEVNNYTNKCAAFDEFDFRQTYTPPYNAALAECDKSWELIAAQVLALRADAQRLLDVVGRAEVFIAGFEDDSTQEGVTKLLADLRAVVAKAIGSQP